MNVDCCEASIRMEYMDYPYVKREGTIVCVGCTVAQNSTKTAKIPGNFVYLASSDCHAYQVLRVRYFFPILPFGKYVMLTCET